MTQPLVTTEQRAQLLAVGAARTAGRSIDPMPAVRLFTPDAHATWLLAALDPADPRRLDLERRLPKGGAQ